MLTTQFRVNWPFGLGEERNIYFQDNSHGGSLGFPFKTISAIFDLLVTPMLPTMFQVNWPFRSGDAKNRFSRWRPWRPSWTSDRNDLTLMLTTQFRVNWPFGSGEERNIYFQDDSHGGNLGFPFKTISAIFDLLVTPMLPTKFQVDWPFGSREKAKNRFSRWLPQRPSWISDWNIFSYFWFTWKEKKDCLRKQRTHTITKIGDSVWLSLFICNTVVCEVTYALYFLPSFKSICPSV